MAERPKRERFKSAEYTTQCWTAGEPEKGVRPIKLEACDRASNWQRWKYDPETKQLHALKTPPGKPECVQTANDGFAKENPLQLRDCTAKRAGAEWTIVDYVGEKSFIGLLR